MPPCFKNRKKALFKEIFYIIINDYYRKHAVYIWCNELIHFKGGCKILPKFHGHPSAGLKILSLSIAG